MINFTSVSGSFADKLWQVMSALELPAPPKDPLLPLNVGDGKVTIGAGCNLTSGKDAVRDAVYEAMGIDIRARSPGWIAEGTALQRETERAYILALDEACKAVDIPRLKAIMAARATNTVLDGFADSRRSDFRFNDMAEARAAFEGSISAYLNEDILAKLPALSATPNFATSQEKIALLAMVWVGGPGMFGEKFRAALTSDNRAEAWYEVRYGWAAKDPKFNAGWAKRHYMESALFGLYDNPASVRQDEAENAFRMLQLHRDLITQRESLYGSMVAQGNSAYSAVLGAMSSSIPSVIQAFDPAKSVLLATLRHDNPGIALDDYLATSIYLDPGRNKAVDQATGLAVPIDPNHAATLDARTYAAFPHPDSGAVELASNDILIGEGGDDHLLGRLGNDILIGGTGSDGLCGGAGTDLYLFKSGDGADMVLDSTDDGYGGDGQGTLYFDGIALTGTFNQKDPDNHPGLYGNADWNLDFIGSAGEAGMLVITRAAGGDDRIVIPNFKSGNLGITLGPEAVPNLTPATPESTVGETAWYNEEHNVINAHDLGRVQLAAVGDFGEVWGNGLLLGNDSANYLHNGDGDDVLRGLGGKDTLICTGGNDQLYGDDGDDALSSGDGDDLLDGGTGSDVLAGGLGSDILEGGDGADYLFGGGDYTATRHDWSVSDGGQLNGQPVINFNQFAGVLVLDGDAADVLNGGAGDDHLWGGEGGDQLHGGTDNDQLVGGSESDVLDGGDGDDKLHGDGSQSSNPNYYTLPQYHGDDRLDGGLGNDRLTGDGGADELYGGDGDDELIGDANEVPVAYHGADYLDGGAGNDTLYGYGKDDVLLGGEGDDTLEGDSSDVPYAEHGKDYLDGGAGNDKLQGDGGDDELFGGKGNDQLFGDADDIPHENQGKDYLDGEEGKDYLRGYAGDDILIGGAGQDELLAEAGNDVLDGGAGDDKLDAGDGDDQLDGGTGADALTGGAGDDTYVFRTGDGAPAADGTIETIFEDSGQDSVRLEGVSADGIKVSAANGGSVLLVEYGAGDQLAIVDGASGVIERYEIGDDALGTSQLIGRYADAAMSGIGTDGRPLLFGGRGDDQLTSNAANAVVSGGRGNDTLTAVGSTTTFLYDQGDGADRIATYGYANTLRFGAGMRPEDLVLSGESGALRIRVGDSDDSVRLENFGFANPYALNSVTRFEFDDGRALSRSDLIDLGIDAIGADAGESILGGQSADRISGLAGNDNLSGKGGDDLLTGGLGNDRLDGGDGNDTYRFNRGDGADALVDSGGVDSLRLGEGIVAGQTVVRHYQAMDGARYLELDFGDGDRVTIRDGALGTLERVVFADGREMDWRELVARLPAIAVVGTAAGEWLVGTAGNDQLDGAGGDDTIDAGAGNDDLLGGAGDDRLQGGAGRDTYHFGFGAGRDTIVELNESNETDGGPNVLAFDLGVLPVQLQLTRDGNDLVVGLRGQADSTRLTGFYAGGQEDWRFRFGEAEEMDFAALSAAVSPDTGSVAALWNGYKSQILADFAADKAAERYTLGSDGKYHSISITGAGSPWVRESEWVQGLVFSATSTTWGWSSYPWQISRSTRTVGMLDAGVGTVASSPFSGGSSQASGRGAFLYGNDGLYADEAGVGVAWGRRCRKSRAPGTKVPYTRHMTMAIVQRLRMRMESTAVPAANNVHWRLAA